MKISLNWIFDHIEGNVADINIVQLVDIFIKKTAEIEGYCAVSFDADFFTLSQVTAIEGDKVTVYSPELKQQCVLSLRSDVEINAWYLIDSTSGCYAWSTMRSVGGTKDVMLPQLFVEESMQAGGWKKTIENSDYIIEIDNKSINHRPDLWGHRGIAREVAALLDFQFKKIDEFTVSCPVTINNDLQGKTGSFSVLIKTKKDYCDRFAALHISDIKNCASSIAMVIRFARLDQKAINYLVDCTNYVMLDCGQPMHAFDAQALSSRMLTVRQAYNKEKLTLLDGDLLELQEHDLVIADGDSSVSLAGIMGGAHTGVSLQTHAVLLEAAHFDAATIRRTAARYKKRTEASMRFEKNLDQYLIEHALQRFLFLLQKQGVAYRVADQMVVLGNTYSPIIINVKHTRIEQLLGTTVLPERVQSILEKLSFGVEKIISDNELCYQVSIPSFRSTKDITIAEDVIEEIGRSIGYDAIVAIMPHINGAVADLRTTYTTRTIKRMLSMGLMMRELYGYSFFDESFLSALRWNARDCVEVKNSISENYVHLVSTLQPHMLKAVADNSVHHTKLRFYEWARVWHDKNGEIIEQKSLSGIFFEQDKSIDFYQGKLYVMQLLQELKLNNVVWQSDENRIFSWLSRHQTARIMHNGECIGIAGMVESNIVNDLCAAQGSAFLFELNGDYLINYKHSITRFVPTSKYPAVRRDISILIPLTVIVDTIVEAIKKIDVRIKTVVLIDFFVKNEWKDQKSLTFHIEMQDEHKTLEHTEVDDMWNKVTAVLTQLGAIIR